MDRNFYVFDFEHFELVALRKESVDRNTQQALKMMKNTEVALRKESVDRNICPVSRLRKLFLSLSARRAWIEMVRDITGTSEGHVALRKESVDRNGCGNILVMSENLSLSARRAWIEMPTLC